MNSELKGLLIGGVLVGAYVWWTRRGGPDGRRSSSLDGSTPTSTLASGWRGSGSSSWMDRQPIVERPGGGSWGRLRVRGYGG